MDPSTLRFPARAFAHALFAVAAVLPTLAGAATIYRCVGSDAQVAYQDQPCATPGAGSEVAIPAAPPPAASPTYALPAASAGAHGSRRSASAAPRAAAGEVSYECRGSDGEVFYRHTRCPATIPAPTSATRAPRRGRGARDGAAVGVTSVRLSRAEACARMHGAIGRAGREHDDGISTYERNLGRDPCR